MNVEEFRLLYEFNSWANHRTLESCASLTDEQLTRGLGSSFPSVRDTLAHILGAEWLWLERWHGRLPNALPKATDYPNLEALRARWSEVERDLLDYVVSLSNEDLARILSIKTTQGVPYSQPLWQMLQHLVNHGSYHRGQIATMLRQLDTKAQATDLIVFYRQRAAQASA
jgi:uncharacterized damage-inducible protein DinB